MKRSLVMLSPNRTHRDKVVVFLLRATGIAMLTALVFCVCPFSWMETIHQWMGLGTLPDIPIVRYLTRSLSGMYAYLGALLLYLAGDIRRHRGTLLFLSVTGLLFSVGIILLDSAVGMPLFWTVAEGPMTLLLSAILLILLLRARG
ncbi:MAG: hypothetical protein GX455_13955 [Phycisphaerae bacterium]|nr:hypothetical protein [Phycisphaerae bacterium]